ncbi:MAG: TerB N-terminal domain-containing protein [Clostridiales Family XIII bacterium]|jgi:hypothetical protein|nr:TerB N-terminal domain-containing protein [Clostridiales Family XIII bacterium]
MKKDDSFIALLNKIFPGENCNADNATEFAGRLALKIYPEAEHDKSQDESFASIKTAQNTRTGTYSPEKLNKSPSKKTPRPDPRAAFNKMKELGKKTRFHLDYNDERAERFCAQAEYLKDFVDDYKQTSAFEMYYYEYATYSNMSYSQFRTYFTWRAKVRQGIVENVSPAYAFCYIFELLNGIGTADPADGFDKMIDFWRSFRSYSIAMDRYMLRWTRAYYVVHEKRLAQSYPEYGLRFPIPYSEGDAAVIGEVKACRWDKLDIIEQSSSFKITNGKFYKKFDHDMIEKCVCAVMHELAALFESVGTDLRKLFFEIYQVKITSLFSDAVYRSTDENPGMVQIDQSETIKWEGEECYSEHVDISRYSTIIGYIMKCIEIAMRRYFGFKPELQAPNPYQAERCLINSEAEMADYSWSGPQARIMADWKLKILRLIRGDELGEPIDRAIKQYFRSANIVVNNGKVYEIKPVEIDMSKLETIQSEYEATVEKLIWEETVGAEADSGVLTSLRNSETSSVSFTSPDVSAPRAPESASTLEIRGMDGFVNALSADEKTILAGLLSEGRISASSELLIESINQKALSAIDDNIIDYFEGSPYVYDDYADELKAFAEGWR